MVIILIVIICKNSNSSNSSRFFTLFYIVMCVCVDKKVSGFSFSVCTSERLRVSL